jgi:NADH-quinone oxidoreductase subunit G
MFMVMTSHLQDYRDLSYAKLTETVQQRPIIGRCDLYYGGTAYENRQGLGKLLSTAASRGETVLIPELALSEPVLTDPDQTDELLALPVTLLFDREAVLLNSPLLGERIAAAQITLNNKTAQKRDISAGDMVKIEIDGVDYPAVVKLDESIPPVNVLVPLNVGIPLTKPILVKVHR